jgi:hypothetical protein
MKKRLSCPTINKAVSSYVGVDWLIIKAAKESGRYEQDIHSQTSMPDELIRQAEHILGK